MAAGYSFGASCFVSQAEALDAHYSAVLPQSVGADSMLYATKGPDGWLLNMAVCPSGGSCSVSTVAAPVDVVGVCTLPPASGLPDSYDYSTLGAVWVFAVGVVVALYILGRSAGVVLSVFRH